VRRISCRESTSVSRAIACHGKQLRAGLPNIINFDGRNREFALSLAVARCYARPALDRNRMNLRRIEIRLNVVVVVGVRLLPAGFWLGGNG